MLFVLSPIQKHLDCNKFMTIKSCYKYWVHVLCGNIFKQARQIARTIIVGLNFKSLLKDICVCVISISISFICIWMLGLKWWNQEQGMVGKRAWNNQVDQIRERTGLLEKNSIWSLHAHYNGPLGNIRHCCPWIYS